MPAGDHEPLTRGEGRAIAEATAETFSKLRRTKLVISTVIATLIVSSAIALTVAIVIGKANRYEARRNTLNNCHVQSSARPQGNARAFDQVSFLRLLQDAIGNDRSPTTKAFAARELAHINHDAAYWHQYTVTPTGNELPAKITSFAELAKTIKPVPLINCAAVVK